MIPMKILIASKLILIATLGLAGLNSTDAQDDAATEPTIDVPTSNTGSSYSFGSIVPRIYVEIERSGKVWLNGKAIDDLSAIDDHLSSLPNLDGKWLKVIFRGDRRASAESFVKIVSQLDEQIERLDVLLTVKIDDSIREYHIGAALLRDKEDSEANKAKAPEAVTGSASASNSGESTSTEEVDSGPEIFRVAVNADGSFTTDGKDLDKVGFWDHWKMVDATANLLNEELHVYAEFDQQCTFQHVVNLLDTAAATHSSAKFKFSITKAATEK